MLSPSVHKATAVEYSPNISSVATKLYSSLSIARLINLFRKGHFAPRLFFNITCLTLPNLGIFTCMRCDVHFEWTLFELFRCFLYLGKSMVACGIWRELLDRIFPTVKDNRSCIPAFFGYVSDCWMISWHWCMQYIYMYRGGGKTD